jgi:hypothetical protein
MKGFTAQDVIGSHLSLLYTDEDNESGWPAHNLQVAKEAGFFREERWRQRKDGALFWHASYLPPYATTLPLSAYDGTVAIITPG